MRIQVHRVSGIPHGSSIYIEHDSGQQPIVWLDADLFTAEEASNLEARLVAPPDPTLLVDVLAAV
jgi:hypothetical protein